MSKIVIIGGGIAGLTAGVFAQKYGYESEIFESHSIVGGECTGWTRNGFHIDNCIQWMTGTNKKTSLYQLWKDIGALGDDIELVKLDRFYTSYFEEKKAVLWRDKERTRKELKKIGRGDGKAIDDFIDAVAAVESINMPAEMPMDMIPKIQLIKMGMSMMGILKYMKKYGKMTIKEFAGTFKNRDLRRFFSDYMGEDFSAFSLIVSYATFTSGNGDIPAGGSVKMVQRIAEKYKSLGGVIHTSSPVEKINIDGSKATGITLENGEFISADYVIPACDSYITFNKLIDKKYMPKQLAESYEKLKVQSAFQVAFGVDDKCDFIYNTEIFPCREITIANSTFDRMGVKIYSYEPSFAPFGKAVLQVHFFQTEEDYEYWKNLYETDKEMYEKKKLEIAEEINLRVSAKYQQINGEIEVLDVVTPYTYNKFTGAYKGSYMSFVYSPETMGRQPLSGLINGLDNVILATQWQQLPGGLPCAATSGKFAVQRIAK